MKKCQKGFVTESPPGVYTIHSMKEIFPIVVETLEKYGRKDTMIVLLLDEAQNFLLGDMNNVGDMAASMKKFCGIIRKFNLCLWLLSPAMRNLGPAFRNFLDGVSQRLFCDRCRQLIEFQGKEEEKQALIDETLRLSVCVSDNAGILEGTIPNLMEYLLQLRTPGRGSRKVSVVLRFPEGKAVHHR